MMCNVKNKEVILHGKWHVDIDNTDSTYQEVTEESIAEPIIAPKCKEKKKLKRMMKNEKMMMRMMPQPMSLLTLLSVLRLS